MERSARIGSVIEIDGGRFRVTSITEWRGEFWYNTRQGRAIFESELSRFGTVVEY